MEDIFEIKVNNQPLEIRALNSTKDGSQFEVWENGKLEFTLEHRINQDSNESWVLVGTYKASRINQDQVDSIGDKIDSHYL